MSQKSTETNPKVRATNTVWTFSISMLALCIPLVAITDSGVILPLFVVLSAGVGTAAVWLGPDKRQSKDAYLAQAMKGLEERVMNLETIYINLPDVDSSLLSSETKHH